MSSKFFFENLQTEPYATPLRIRPKLKPEYPAYGSLVTPLKPRLRPLASSLMYSVESLPMPMALEPSPSVDELAVATLSSMSPMVELLSMDDSDLQIGSIGDIKDSPPLRTPFHPSSPPPLSPDIPLLIDLLAFPMFDAKIGPIADSTVSLVQSLSNARPKLRRESTVPSLDQLSASSEESLFSPSFSTPGKRKISYMRHSNTYRSLNIVKKNQVRVLCSVPEVPPRETMSIDSPCPAQSSGFVARPLNLRKRSTAFTAVDSKAQEGGADVMSPLIFDLSIALDPSPHNSNAKARRSRPTQIPGFIQNLPPFRLPTSPPSAFSPISISPATPSRCTTPLRSPFLIRRKSDSKWKPNSDEYFSSVPTM